MDTLHGYSITGRIAASRQQSKKALTLRILPTLLATAQRSACSADQRFSSHARPIHSETWGVERTIWAPTYACGHPLGHLPQWQLSFSYKLY